MRHMLSTSVFGDVSLAWPAIVCIAGLGVAIAGKPYIGIGIVVGAILALGNSALLVKRVELAATSDLAPVAMVSMQLGLLVTFTIVGGVAVVMVLISLAMTIAMAVSFLVTQTGELILYYRSRRSRLDASRKPV